MNTLLITNQSDNKICNTSVTYLQNVWDKVWNDSGENTYSRLRLFKTIDKIKTISKLGVDFKNKHVLDIGCGDGTTLDYLNSEFAVSGLGIDISPFIINKNKTKFRENKNFKFQVGDHREITNQNNSFDIVLSWGVVEHMEEYAQAITEARRLLKPNGILVLIQPNLYSFGVLQEYYLRMIGKWKYGKQKDFTYSFLKKTLISLGLKDIKYIAKPPYKDMPICRIGDKIMNKIFKHWGHYLYIISKK